MNSTTLHKPARPVTNEDLWDLLAMMNQRLERLEVAQPVKPAQAPRRGCPAGMDETEYLMSNPANRAHLERAQAELEAGHVITFDSFEALMHYTKGLLE